MPANPRPEAPDAGSDIRPLNCRDRLESEGKAHPKSGCEVEGCQPLFGRQVCTGRNRTPAARSAAAGDEAATAQAAVRLMDAAINALCRKVQAVEPTMWFEDDRAEGALARAQDDKRDAVDDLRRAIAAHTDAAVSAALAEVERLRAELAIAAPGGLLGSEWGRSTFARLFGQTYQPVRWGKHEATHPTTLDQALRIAGQRAPELGDVIAVLVWRSCIVDNRAQAAFDEASAQQARADRLDAVLRSLEWTGTTDRDDGGDEACCPRCGWPERLGDHAPECTVAAALTAGGEDGR